MVTFSPYTDSFVVEDDKYKDSVLVSFYKSSLIPVTIYLNFRDRFVH